jgi:hypothetical protein
MLEISPALRSGFRYGVSPPVDQLFDPVDQLLTLWIRYPPLWTSKTGLQGGLGGKRSRCLWISEGLMLLQLDPLDHHFDPEGQAPTLWVRTN